MSAPTMAEAMPDLVVAHLMRDYIAHADSITAGVADNDALPKEVMDSGEPPALPSLVFAAREENSSGAKRIVVVSAILMTWLKSGDAAAANVATQITRGEASALLRPVDDRLRDHSAFGAWLAAQSESRRSGFRIMHIIEGGAATPMRVPETRQIHYGVTLTFTLAVSRFAV